VALAAPEMAVIGLRCVTLHGVMAGLVPAIHVFPS